MELAHHSHQPHPPSAQPHAQSAQPQMQPQIQPQNGAQPAQTIPYEETKEAQIYQLAAGLFHKKPDWVTFYREVLGIEGMIRRAYPNQADLLAFEQTKEYSEIQQMVAKLRERSNEPAENREPTRVITVRLPKSLHESLRTEAHERKTSMNKLCISKLLQMVDSDLIPSD